MIIRKLLCCLYLFCLPIIGANAQNTILVADDTIQLPKSVNSLLPTALADLIDADSFLITGLKAIRKAHFAFRGFDFYYSFFPETELGYALYPKLTDRGSFDYDSAFVQLKKLAFQHKNLFEAFYAIAGPLYSKAIGKMTDNETEELLFELKQGLNYAQNFNLKKEKSLEKKLGSKFARRQGKMKAFIYRRITQNDLSKEECVYWLEKIYKDALLAIKPKKRVEENYLITYRLMDTYYLAIEYEEYKKYNEDERLTLMQKDSSGFHFAAPLFSELIKYESFEDEQIIFLYYSHQGGEKELRCFLKNEEGPARMEKFKIPDGLDRIWNIKGDSLFVAIYDNDDIDFFYIKKDSLNNFSIRREATNKKIDFRKGDRIHSYNYTYLPYKDEPGDFFYRKGDSSYQGIGIVKIPYYITDTKPVELSETDNRIIFISKRDDFKHEIFIIEPDTLRIIPLEGACEFDEIESWKNYFIATVHNYDERISYHTLYSSEGKIILDSIFLMDFIDADIVLLQRIMGKHTFFAIADSQFNILSPFIYQFETQPSYGTEMNSDQYFAYDDLLGKNSFVLFHYEYGKNKLVGSKALVYNYQGEVLIPEKWPYIELLHTDEMDPDFYAVCEKVSFDKLTIKPVGKYALFDSKGKQLTPFIYDKIEVSYDEETDKLIFNCYYGKKMKQLNAEGKEIN